MCGGGGGASVGGGHASEVTEGAIPFMLFVLVLSFLFLAKREMKGFKEGLLLARESEVAFGGVGSAFSMSKKKHFNFRGRCPP